MSDCQYTKKVMKKIAYLLALLIFSASCSDDDSISTSLSVSNSELSFSADGGEQIVEIVSNGFWDCDYTEDWLLVRQQQDRIKVIADANLTGSERTAYIQVFSDGEAKAQIVVLQEGLMLDAEASDYEVQYLGEEFIIPVDCNSAWKAGHEVEWIETQQEANGLKVVVSRNYQMQERTGEIVLTAGELQKSIAVNQTASPWYDSFEMVAVEAGSFYMGAQNTSSAEMNYDESAYMVEAPVHHVTLAGYNIGVFEVTQAQWVSAMGTNPSFIQGDNLPVENVSWEQVQEFIALLNEASGKEYRLPTEAEWEFAARGGNLSEGFKYSGYSVLGACGWYYSNSESTTHEVGTKFPNELGIYDMNGNVREWCDDWFEYYSSDETSDPQGPDYGDMKVNRGGSWTTPAANCRNSYRQADYPSEASQDLGFRLAL